jgi:hypothetical protein
VLFLGRELVVFGPLAIWALWPRRTVELEERAPPVPAP